MDYDLIKVCHVLLLATAELLLIYLEDCYRSKKNKADCCMVFGKSPCFMWYFQKCQFLSKLYTEWAI